MLPNYKEQLLPEYGSCMATVDEDMSEGREALESQVKQHQSATNLNDGVLHLWTVRHEWTIRACQRGDGTSRYRSHTCPHFWHSNSFSMFVFASRVCQKMG